MVCMFVCASGKVASEEETLVKTPRIVGAAGPNMRKNVEEGKSCEKTTIPAAMGQKPDDACTMRPKSGNSAGDLHQKRTQSCEEPTDVWCSRAKNMEKLRKFCIRRGKILQITPNPWCNGDKNVEKCWKFCIRKGQIL